MKNRRVPGGNISVVSEHVHTKPEHRLWLAVLSRAIQDIELSATDKKMSSKIIGGLEWIIANDDTEEVGTFRYVCNVLDFEYEAIRKAILEANEEELHERIYELKQRAKSKGQYR